MNEFMMMGTASYLAFKQAYRVDVWRKMMSGDIPAWCDFFRMIEDGESRQMLREHVKYG
jgi:hypothetical protein